MTVMTAEELAAKRARLSERIAGDGQSAPTSGVNHIAIEVWDLERSLDFYCGLLGFPLVNVNANRDEPLSTHVNVDIGGNMALSLFDFPHLDRIASEGAGGVMHIAIAADKERLEEAQHRLDEAGRPYQQIGGNLYFPDPDGLTLELFLAE